MQTKKNRKRTEIFEIREWTLVRHIYRHVYLTRLRNRDKYIHQQEMNIVFILQSTMFLEMILTH
jgi:translation initiation factor IF-3